MPGHGGAFVAISFVPVPFTIVVNIASLTFLVSNFVQFLDPDADAVERLAGTLLSSNMGVVAHYYMDVELQGVLHAVQRFSPALAGRVGIADSLKMGDIAVNMCKNDGVTSVACLGVDFMSESVQAIMDKNGYLGLVIRILVCGKCGK